MYNEIDGTYATLFPESLSTNNKIARNISFEKIPGRAQHGTNIHARKVLQKGAQIILKPTRALEQVNDMLKHRASESISSALSPSVYGKRR